MGLRGSHLDLAELVAQYISTYKMSSGLVQVLAGLSLVSSSYLPPYYSGLPTSSRVVSLDPPDYRGEESYRIDFTLEPRDDSPSQGFVHRTWADFQKLDHLLTTHLINWGLDFPSEPSIDNLDSYLQRLLTHSIVVSSNQFSDFLGINWSGKDLNFLQSLPDFMQIVIPPLYRAPDFPPEPPVFTTEMERRKLCRWKMVPGPSLPDATSPALCLA